MKNKSILRVALVTILILLVPFMAMQFTQEVNWSLSDFIVAGMLLFSTGLAYELVMRKGTNAMYRLAAGVAISTAFLLIWANLAVGLVGSGANPANLMYVLVPIVAIIVTIAVGYQARGMVRVLFATAAAQFLVPVIALLLEITGITSGERASEIKDMAGVTILFVILWIVSALLFKRAGSDPQASDA